MTPEALHSSTNSRWITPVEIIEAARTLMGSIDLDPASEELANTYYVKARHYYNEQQDGLNSANTWFGNVWLNPPGDKSGKLTKRFYERLVNEYKSDNVKQACYLAFTLNQLATLQDIYPPTHYPFIIFRQRIQFVDARTKEIGTQPAHHSALIYLPPNPYGASKKGLDAFSHTHLNRFTEVFSKFGAVTIPE